MGKNLENRNLLTIYVRKEYRELIKTFDNLIEKDPSLQGLRYKDKDKLRSVVIMQLILRYVREKGADKILAKEEVKNDDKE